MTSITFGTDGWRAIVGKDFTFDNVKIVAQAIADYVKEHQLDRRGIIVGYDTRKGSRDFADDVCRVMVGNNILTYVTSRDTPTPVTAFEVLRKKAGGAVMITASHNPPEWNGIKYIPEYAGPALPEITEEITRYISRVLRTKTMRESSIKKGNSTPLLKRVDPSTSYIEFVLSQIDMRSLKKARLKIVCDLMYGTARGYLHRILRRVGCRVTVIHNEPDPSFGGTRPEPLPEFLTELRSTVRSLNADLGLATDGDADRMAVYDSDGTYLAADQLFPMLFDYLISRGYRGGVVRTIATTHLVDRIAKKHGLPIYEVPVGFKYVGQYLREKDILIGAEESGGMSFKGHISEKDGIFACIKTTEMIANTGNPLTRIFGELMSKYGSIASGRDDVRCPDSLKRVVMEELSSEIPDEVGNTKVSLVNKMDGIKLLLEDGGWLLIRPSGTEPLIRIYGESTDNDGLRENLQQGKNIVLRMLRRHTPARP